MPEESLNGADISATLKEVGSEGVAKCVERDAFWDAGLSNSDSNGTRDHAGVDVMPTRDSGERIGTSVF